MATKHIRKAAVIGAGVMGRGIAAHLANARIPCVLLDIVPPNPAEGQDTTDPAWRSSFAAGAVAGMKKEKPSPIFSKLDLSLITPGNIEDHLELLADVDWVVEVVPERMDIKQGTLAKIEAHAHPEAIISSNTSGLSIAGMLEGRSEAFKQRFLVTHFFNPVRYMKLLELVPAEETDPEVMETLVKFGQDVLGKGIVFGKDTTNFIANRIGVHGMMTIMNTMSKYDMTPAAVDVIFGKAMGRPRSAVFGTADLVGLDTFVHVSQNCYDTLTEDEERDVFVIPQFVKTMVENGWLGRKTKAGFFKKVGKEIHALNLETLEYEPRVKPRFDSIGAAKGTSGPAESIAKVVVEGEDDAAKFAREVTLRSLAYSARRLGEIADDVVNVDRGMRWGFNWELGPFQTWDALGVKWAYDAMKEHGIEVPAWVDAMVEAGVESFYSWDGTTELFYDYLSGEYKPVARDAKEQSVTLLKRGEKKVFGNDGATLYDGGDGVAVLEFHTKMNSIDNDVIEMMHRSIEEVEANDWEGLVIANDSDNFSVGANLMLIYMAASQGAWDQVEEIVKQFQDANQRMRFSHKPVVTAPTGMTFGGGAEVTMGGNAVQAAGELYIGLVEVGVGLIPGGGGNLQLMRNIFGAHAAAAEFNPLPFIQKVFMSIGMAKVATSAEEAREIGFLTANDGVTLNRSHVLHAAKERVLGMSRAGFRAPRPMKFRLPGSAGVATIDMLLYSMVQNNQISDYDRHIGAKLANVLCGGQTSTSLLVDEQTLLDLEREVFLSLCGEEKTQARIQHMLMNNKPLRN